MDAYGIKGSDEWAKNFRLDIASRRQKQIEGLRQFETDRLLKLLTIESDKHGKREFALIARPEGFKAFQGAPLFHDKEWKAILKLEYKPSIKEALIDAIVQPPLAEVFSNDRNVTCPKCGFDCIHPIAVSIEPLLGRLLIVINSSGLEIRNSEAARSQRGISILTTYQGECGHQWTEMQQFHKGTTSITTSEIIDLGKDGDFDLRTLWRD